MAFILNDVANADGDDYPSFADVEDAGKLPPNVSKETSRGTFLTPAYFKTPCKLPRDLCSDILHRQKKNLCLYYRISFIAILADPANHRVIVKH